MAQTSASAARGQVGVIQSARCRVGNNMPETGIRSQIQGRAVGDECSRREYIGRGSDGAVVSGSQPHEMAPGSYHMVFRDVRAASLPQGVQTFSRRVSLAFQQLLQLARPGDSGQKPALGLLTAFAR